MLRQVTWKSWVVLGIVLAAYAGLGVWFSGNANVEATMYKWGLLTATVAPILFTVIYTITGSKWWKNDLGSALVQSMLCLVPIADPLAWVFWVNHGILTSSALAWIEVSGPVLSTLAILRLGYVFSRIHRETKQEESS